jgi:gas vesicle protein
MPSWGGAAAGAASGALAGKAGGPIGMLIGGGIGAIGGLFGGGKSKLQKQVESLIKPSMDNLTHWSGQAKDQQRMYEPLAFNDLSKASRFYGGLLSNSGTEALNNLLGPQRQGIMQGYNNLIQTAGRTGARGGGRTSAMMDFDFAKNRDLMNLVPQARLMAAEGLLSTSRQAGAQALGYGNLAGNMASSVMSAGLGGQDSLAQQGMAAGAGWGQIGGKLGDILGPALSDWIKRMGGNKGGAGGSLGKQWSIL